MFIFFDAVGTLLFPKPDVVAVYYQAGRLYGSHLNPDQIRSRFQELFEQHFSGRLENSDGLRTSEQAERQRWFRLVSELFAEVADLEGLFQALWRHFSQAGNWALFQDVPALLAELTARQIPFGIASNFDSRLTEVVKEFESLQTAHLVLTSAAIGWRKPALEFFQSAARLTGVEPSKIWMVGDNHPLDVLAARSAGWNAIQIDRTRGSPKSGSAISNLNELLSSIGLE